MLSRRALVGKLAASTAAVVAVGVVGKGSAAARGTASLPAGSRRREDALAPVPDAKMPEAQVVDANPPATLSAPAPWELLRPLALGSVVANGWRVAALTGAVDGSCVLTLRNEQGQAHRIHLCRNDGRPQGLVHTTRFDLVVMNGGEGQLPTDEGFAQVVAQVAHVLARNERAQVPQPLMTALLPHSERVRFFAGAEDRRLR